MTKVCTKEILHPTTVDGSGVVLGVSRYTDAQQSLVERGTRITIYSARSTSYVKDES